MDPQGQTLEKQHQPARATYFLPSMKSRAVPSPALAAQSFSGLMRMQDPFEPPVASSCICHHPQD